jgi:hypothetical protein
MLTRKLKTPLPAVFILALLMVPTGPLVNFGPRRCEAAGKANQPANEQPPAGFSAAEFKKLKPILDLKNQPWTKIPWQYSITEARRLAAKTKKPIFMVINTGNCLGWT